MPTAMGGDNLAAKLVVPHMEVGLCYKFLNLFITQPIKHKPCKKTQRNLLLLW